MEPEVAVTPVAAPAATTTAVRATAKPFKERALTLVAEMALEALGTGLALSIIIGVHYVVEWTLGHEAKFFDYIPVRWVFDVAHVALVMRLVWRILKKFNDE